MRTLLYYCILAASALILALASLHFFSFFDWFTRDAGISLVLIAAIALYPVMRDHFFLFFIIFFAVSVDVLSLRSYPFTAIALMGACAITSLTPFYDRSLELHIPLATFSLIMSAGYSVIIHLVQIVFYDIRMSMPTFFYALFAMVVQAAIGYMFALTIKYIGQRFSHTRVARRI